MRELVVRPRTPDDAARLSVRPRTKSTLFSPGRRGTKGAAKESPPSSLAVGITTTGFAVRPGAL